MSLNFFDQFLSPQIFGIPLIIMAMAMPALLVTTKTARLLPNRLSTMQTWLLVLITKQLFLPLNKAGHKWALILLTVMLFLASLNMMGLLPYTFTPTTQLSMNMGMAIPLWFATVIIGLRNQPTISIGHLLPEGTPTLLVPILIVIETISLLIRPLALGVRLTANLTAGHLLIQLISTAVFVLLPIMPMTATLTLTVLILLTGLEIAVAMIQAYVFTLLLSLYLQENV